MAQLRLRDITPRGLYARTLLLLLGPVLLILGLMTWYYYANQVAEVNRKLAQAIAARGVAGRAVTHLDLADVIAPPVPAGFAGQARVLAVDIAAPGTAAALVADRP